MSDARIHQAAARGFDAAVDRYERGRPSYPADSVAFLARELGLRPGREILELGAGTGKFTELLLPSGASVTTVEPVYAMRERLAANCPAAIVVDGMAEAISLGPTSS